MIELDREAIPEYDGTEESATAWFKAMYAQNASFHPEDPAEDIIHGHGQEMSPMFDHEDAQWVQKTLDRILNNHDDPCAIANDVWNDCMAREDIWL